MGLITTINHEGIVRLATAEVIAPGRWSVIAIATAVGNMRTAKCEHLKAQRIGMAVAGQSFIAKRATIED
jgi:hypothetical protein